MKELLKKKGFLFDVEGVLTDNIDEGHGLSNTANFISLLKKHNKKIAIITNISRKPRQIVYRKLLDMGLPIEEHEVFTSGATTALYIKDNFPHATCFVISEWGLKKDIEDAGITIAEGPDADVVAIGADRTVTFAEINHAMRLVSEGSRLLCSGTTKKFYGNYLGDKGFFLGEAALAEAISYATNKKITFIGKPYPAIFEKVLSSIGVNSSESVMFGDNISSDISGANSVGIESILVTNQNRFDFDKLTTAEKPNYVITNINELYQKFIS